MSGWCVRKATSRPGFISLVIDQECNKPRRVDHRSVTRLGTQPPLSINILGRSGVKFGARPAAPQQIVAHKMCCGAAGRAPNFRPDRSRMFIWRDAFTSSLVTTLWSNGVARSSVGSLVLSCTSLTSKRLLSYTNSHLNLHGAYRNRMLQVIPQAFVFFFFQT